MIKYNNATINDWYYDTSGIIKVYRNNAVCYYKIDTSSPSGQTPCFAVVDNISQYSETEFEDVFNLADNKWYKLNNLNQYEEYGIYGSGRTITTYDGKLTIDTESTPQPSRLPAGYTEVEYIRQNSNYDAYINTGVILFDNTSNTYTVTTKLTSEFHSNLGCATIISAEVPVSPYNGMGYRYKCSSTVDQLEFFGGNSNYTSSVVDNGDGTRTVTFQSTGNTSWTSSAPLSLLCSFSDTSFTTPFRYADATIYSATIVKNGTTVRDFVPAKRDSDDKYGLYDLVTDTFYTSPNDNNFSGGSEVIPPPITATCEFMYSGGSWVNLGEVTGGTASLPDVPFTVNYNAKNYNSSTKTLLKTSGQLADVDAVIAAGTPTVHDGYLTIATNTRATISGYQTYFNRDNNNPNITIISKQMTDGSNCHIFANRGSSYNWMYRAYYNKLTLHGASEQGSVSVTTQPVIESVRINSSRLATYNNYTNGTSSTYSNFSYGSTNSRATALFAGYDTSSGEWFVGDFYWIYMSQTTLTDEQVQQVIAYNEGGGGQTEYPLEYVVREDPPDNLTFNTMEEAEAYECPWVGMKAKIDGDNYVFSGDSQSGYEWVYNPSRLPVGYTEVEYVENTGTSYINTNLQLCSATTNTFQVEAKLVANRIGSQSYQNVFSCMSEDGEPYQGFTYRFVGSNISPTFIPSNDGSFTQVSNEDGTKSVTASSMNGLTYSHTYPLTICCGLDSSRNPFRFTNTKVYTFKVTFNNNVVADYVPAMRDSDNKYGLYDLITDTFLVSPNGSNFVGGSPV